MQYQLLNLGMVRAIGRGMKNNHQIKSLVATLALALVAAAYTLAPMQAPQALANSVDTTAPTGYAISVAADQLGIGG